MAGPGYAYSDKERLTCFTYYCMGKSLAEISREREPSIPTLQNWARQDNWEARRQAINERAWQRASDELVERKAEFVEIAWQKIRTMLDEVDSRERLDKAAIHHMTTAIGTLIDKAQLLSGEPTERKEVDTLADREELAGRIRRLAERTETEADTG